MINCLQEDGDMSRELSLRAVQRNAILHGIGSSLYRLFRLLLMVSTGFIILYPLLYMVSMSLREVQDVYDQTVVWIPRNFTLSNFAMVLSVTQYFNSLKNTILVSVGSAVIQVIMCSFIGYGFARFRFRGREIMFGILLFTIIVPPQMLSLPTFLLFKDFDLFGVIRLITGAPSGLTILENPLSFYILSFFGMGIRSGLFILIMRQFYRQIPLELEQAAMVDGCGYLRTYLRIMLPNARNAVTVVLLFSIVWHWNDYYMSSIYLGTYPTVSTRLAGIRGLFEVAMRTSNWDPYQIVTMEQAGCLLSILPLLVLYLLLQRHFTESIERTGLVG